MKRDTGGNDEGGDPDDFKNRLAAMLSRGPSATVAKKPPVISAQQTNEEIVDAKLSIPKVTRQRANTKKYDLAQFDFDGF